jgi:hypothetical protein
MSKRLNVLVVGAERAEEFAYAKKVADQGHQVIVVNPKATPEANAFKAAGGDFRQIPVSRLPSDMRFDLICEDFPHPKFGYDLQPFVAERAGRLAPGGTYVTVTENVEMPVSLSWAAHEAGLQAETIPLLRQHESTPRMGEQYGSHPAERVVIMQAPDRTPAAPGAGPAGANQAATAADILERATRGLFTIVGAVQGFVTATGQATARGESRSIAIVDGVVGALSAVLPFGNPDAIINFVTGNVSPSAIAQVISDVTPSQTSRNLVTSLVDVVAADFSGNRREVERWSTNMLAGRYGEVMRGFAVLGAALKDVAGLGPHIESRYLQVPFLDAFRAFMDPDQNEFSGSQASDLASEPPGNQSSSSPPASATFQELGATTLTPFNANYFTASGNAVFVSDKQYDIDEAPADATRETPFADGKGLPTIGDATGKETTDDSAGTDFGLPPPLAADDHPGGFSDGKGLPTIGDATGKETTDESAGTDFGLPPPLAADDHPGGFSDGKGLPTIGDATGKETTDESAGTDFGLPPPLAADDHPGGPVFASVTVYDDMDY